jgi:hypothetical protein
MLSRTAASSSPIPTAAERIFCIPYLNLKKLRANVAFQFLRTIAKDDIDNLYRTRTEIDWAFIEQSLGYFNLFQNSLRGGSAGGLAAFNAFER